MTSCDLHRPTLRNITNLYPLIQVPAAVQAPSDHDIPEEDPMLLRTTDPFRELDRLTQQVWGSGRSTALPTALPMDAWREADHVVIELDVPGVAREEIDVDVERNVLTVRAERPPRDQDGERLASERPTGTFSRQLVLGDNLDLDRVEATYEAGVLRLRVPVAERAKPHKIAVSGSEPTDETVAIEA